MPDAPPTPPLGPLIIGVGVAIVLIGVLVWTGALNWFGRLPGDIRHETGSTRIYVPLASMLLISVALSLVAAVVRRFF
jgi:hypothetical protein